MDFKECPKCGNLQDSHDSVCEQCGAELRSIEPVKNSQSPKTIKYMGNAARKRKLTSNQNVRSGIAVFTSMMILFLLTDFSEDEPKKVEATSPVKTAKVVPKEKVCDPNSVMCLGEKNRSIAVPQCIANIEARARYSFEWTDSLFGDPKFGFDNYMWVDPANGVIAYSGNQIKMQNGFGAWEKVIYQCQFNINLGVVTKVILM